MIAKLINEEINLKPQLIEAILIESESQEMKNLGLKFENDPKSKNFREVRYILRDILEYPLTDYAQLHQQANILGSYDLVDEAEQEERLKLSRADLTFEDLIFCPDCGFVRQKQQLHTCSTETHQLTHIGTSTYLYFQMIKRMTYLMLILLFVYSIFATFTNYLAVQYDYRQTKIGTFQSYTISLGAKQYNRNPDTQIYFVIQAWIGVAVIAIWMIAVLFLKRLQNIKTLSRQILTKSAADFSLVVENLPTSVSLESFERQLNEHLHYQIYDPQSGVQQITPQVKVMRFNQGKPFEEHQENITDDQYTQLLDTKKQLREKFIEMVLYRKDHLEFQESKSQRIKLYKEYIQNKENIIKKYHEFVHKIRKQYEKERTLATTTVFVTFASNKQRDLAYQQTRFILWRRIFAFLSCHKISSRKFIFQTDNSQQITVNVEQAPEPEDIIWKNIGVSKCEIWKRKIITFFATFVILVLSFLIQYGLTVSQKFYPPAIISIIISLFNIILSTIILNLSASERDYKSTDFQLSLAIKSVVAQLINSIAIPILLERTLHEVYEPSGLADQIFSFSITNALIPPILKIVNLNYLVKKIQRWHNRKPQSKLYLTQSELNQSFENLSFEIGLEYVYIINTFLFTSFFITLQPSISIFAILSYLLIHFAQKYYLFNYSKRPIPGTDLINTILSQFVYASGVFYAFGSIYAASLVTDGVSDSSKLPNLIAVLAGIAFFLIPYESLFKYILNTANEPEEMYLQNKIFLPSEYDRLNPATAQSALNQHLQFIEQKKKQFRSKSLEDQEQIIKALKLRGINLRRRDEVSNNPNHSGFAVNAYISEVNNNSVNPILVAAQLSQNKAIDHNPATLRASHEDNNHLQKHYKASKHRQDEDLPEIPTHPYEYIPFHEHRQKQVNNEGVNQDFKLYDSLIKKEVDKNLHQYRSK